MYTYVYENQENPEVFHPNLSLQRWKKKLIWILTILFEVYLGKWYTIILKFILHRFNDDKF